MYVLGERIEHALRRAAHADQRQLALERNPAFRDRGHALELIPTRDQAGERSRDALAAAVVADAPRLQHDRPAERAACLVRDPVPPRSRRTAPSECRASQTAAFRASGPAPRRSRPAVERPARGRARSQARRRRRSLSPTLERPRRLRAARARAASSRAPTTISPTCAARGIRVAIEKHAVDAERIARKREHAAELTGTDDAYPGSTHGTAKLLRGGARIGIFENFGGLRGAIPLERGRDRRILVGEDRGGEQPRIDRACLADRERVRPALRAAFARSTAASRDRPWRGTSQARRERASEFSRPSCRAGVRHRPHPRSAPRVPAPRRRWHTRREDRECGARRSRGPRTGWRAVRAPRWREPSSTSPIRTP